MWSYSAVNDSRCKLLMVSVCGINECVYYHPNGAEVVFQSIFRFRYLVTSGRDIFRNMLRGAALLFTSYGPISRGRRLLFRGTRIG